MPDKFNPDAAIPAPAEEIAAAQARGAVEQGPDAAVAPKEFKVATPAPAEEIVAAKARGVVEQGPDAAK